MLDAKCLALDISRKAGKGVHVLHTKFCNSTLSVMNEYGQILLSVMCPVESMKEGACRLGLDALASNLKRRGVTVAMTSTDKPDCDQVLRQVFGKSSTGVYHFSGEKLVVNGSDVDSVDDGVVRLRAAIALDTELNSRAICTVDAEWPSARTHGSTVEPTHQLLSSKLETPSLHYSCVYARV